MSEEKEVLEIDVGLLEYPYCDECRRLIDKFEYMARNFEYQNCMCLGCTVDMVKDFGDKIN